MELSIIEIKPKYLDEVVQVHIQAFPSFFLTFLGPAFLKHFYASFTYDNAGLGFVALNKEDNNVVGVIVGPVDPEGYFKRLLIHRFLAFCFASFKAVLKKPIIIKRLFRAVFYRGEAPTGPQRALLSSIAVSTDHQKEGVGRALVEKWMAEVKSRGGNGCFLTTDAIGNEKVNLFYENLGWIVESTYETPEGRKMNRYCFDFEPQEKNTGE